MPHPVDHSSRLNFPSPILLVIVLAFAAGISRVPNPFHEGKLLEFSIASLIGIIFYFNKYKPRWHNFFCLFLSGFLFFLLGLQLSYSSLKPFAAANHVSNLIKNKQIVTISGILLQHPAVFRSDSGPETRIIMMAKTMYRPAEMLNKKGNSDRIDGLIQLTVNGSLPDNLWPGDHFLVRAALAPVTTFSTPGSFNYKRHLATRSILVKGWVQSPVNIMKFHPLSSSPLKAWLHTIWFLPERIRHGIAIFLDKTMDQPARGIYKAILIGDRTDVPTSILESFTAAGCIHILAISGVHMGLLALITTAALTWLLRRSQMLLLSHIPIRKIVAVITLLPLFLYALIAGFNIPVLRAFLMAAVFFLAILFDRPANLPNHILLAGFLILLWQPGSLFTASFQLSFSAIIAIALIYPLLGKLLIQINNGGYIPSSICNGFTSRLFRWLTAGIGVTIAATLGTLPLLIYHFNRFSLVAPISNLLVEPIICFWSLIFGLFACLWIPIAPIIAQFFFFTGALGITGAEKICTFFSSLSHAFLWLPTPSYYEITLYYIFLASTALPFYHGNKRRFLSITVTVSCLLALSSPLAIISLRKHFSTTPSVWILDVGHGSSLLLQLPHNHNILIDGGGAGSDRFNIGERVIAPFLWKRRISSLDAVIISHAHADHYNGLPFILNRFVPKVLWTNGNGEYDLDYRQLLNLAARLGIETRIAHTDDLLFQDEGISLACIADGNQLPHEDKTDSGRGRYTHFNPNNISLVLRLDVGTKSFLFPADIDAKMEDYLVEEGRKISADVLLAPHHGSRSSLSLEFLERVDPKFVAISAGRNNPFNLPDQSFLDLQKKGIDILTTGKDGTLIFKVVNNKITVSSYQVN